MLFCQAAAVRKAREEQLYLNIKLRTLRHKMQPLETGTPQGLQSKAAGEGENLPEGANNQFCSWWWKNST